MMGMYVLIGFVLWMMSSYFVVKYNILNFGNDLEAQFQGVAACFLCACLWPVTFSGAMVLLFVNLKR
jgi:hypothetical protein